MHKNDEIIDVEIIDTKEVDGVYQPVNRTVKRQANKQHKPLQINAQIIHTHQQPQSSVEDLIYGFNEGVRLLNKFIKLIR